MISNEYVCGFSLELPVENGGKCEFGKMVRETRARWSQVGFLWSMLCLCRVDGLIGKKIIVFLFVLT